MNWCSAIECLWVVEGIVSGTEERITTIMGRFLEASPKSYLPTKPCDGRCVRTHPEERSPAKESGKKWQKSDRSVRKSDRKVTTNKK